MYLIQCDSYFPERSLDDTTRAAVIHDIRQAQVTDISRIIRLDPDGRWADATREIAQAIMDELDEPPRGAVEEFLESVLGCRAVADVTREMEGQAA